MLSRNEYAIKRAKGVQRTIVDKEITHYHYLNVYQHHQPTIHTMRQFVSKNHKIETVINKKRSLSVFEDKRYWVSNNKSVALGHYSLMSQQHHPQQHHPQQHHH